jgi:hypothetical protein
MPTTPAGTQASQDQYLWSVNPLTTFPGSNIRQVRPAFVDQLVQRILDHGWDAGSFPTVYEPIEGKELRTVHEKMSASELQDLTFKIMDGAHRLAALRRLQRDPSVPAFGPNFEVQVFVMQPPGTSVQCAADAAGLNSIGKAAFARRTFCDEVWTNLGIQTDFVGRLVAFSAAVNAAEAEARSERRGKVHFKDLADLPLERQAFVTGYEKRVDENLYNKTRQVRAQFEAAVHDFPTPK